MKRILLILLTLFSLTSCLNKKEFVVTKIKDRGQFKFNSDFFKTDFLYYNGFSVEIKNLSGRDITSAYPSTEKHSSSLYITVEAQTKSIYFYNEFEEEISTKNPWINGDVRTLTSYKTEEGVIGRNLFAFDKYTLKNYKINKADIRIEIIAINNILDYKFIGNIGTIDLKNDLENFLKNVDINIINQNNISEDKSKVDKKINLCFKRVVSKVGVEKIQLNEDKKRNKIVGVYGFYPNIEVDSWQGVIKAKRTENGIEGFYTYSSEGNKYIEPFLLKIKNDTAIYTLSEDMYYSNDDPIISKRKPLIFKKIKCD